MARKPVEEISYEFETIRRIPGVNNYHFYSVGSYNESPQGMHRFIGFALMDLDVVLHHLIELEVAHASGDRGAQ